MIISATKILKALRLAKRGLADLDRLIESLAADYVKAQAQLTLKAQLALESKKLGDILFRTAREQEARAIVKRLNKVTPAKTKKIARESVRLGDRMAKVAGIDEVPSTYSKVNQEAIDTLAENLTNRLDAAAHTVGRRVEDIYRREGLRLAALQLADEQTTEDAVDSLVTRLRKQGVTSFTDKAGREWKIDTYADMVIKTVSSEGIFTGTQNRMLARGLDVVRVNKVDAPCPLCVPYDDEIFSLTGRAEGYPLLDVTFPIHPRCRHFITPSVVALSEREDYEDKLAA